MTATQPLRELLERAFPDATELDVLDRTGGGDHFQVVVTAPSLFDAVPVVVIRNAQDAGREVAEELAALAADPPPDVALVITHAGGAKGKALLSRLTGHGAQLAAYPKLTRIGDRMTFIREEFRADDLTADIEE